MPPFSFQFHHPTEVDMFELRQHISNFHFGVLHCIDVKPPYVVVHYANFTNHDVRNEIETKGKMVGNWIFLPLSKN